EAAVVDVEAGRQPEARIEWEGGDERAGLEAAGLELRGERLCSRRQAIPGVLAVSVLKRVEPGQDAGVRRQRDHRMGMRKRKADAGTRERVDRRGTGRTAVDAERVAAQRIDRDEQDVAVGRLNNVRRSPTVAGARRRDQRDRRTQEFESHLRNYVSDEVRSLDLRSAVLYIAPGQYVSGR